MVLPLGAIGGIFQSFLNMGAQQDELALKQKALNLQQQTASDQYQLATADQKDANGNVIKYVEGQGFETILAPIIKRILDAGNREQLATLEKDAPRARKASERKDTRSQMAAGEFEKVFADILGEGRKSEKEYQADAVLDTFANRSNTGNPVNAAVVAQALRSGDPDAVTRLVTGSKGQGSRRSDLRNAERAGVQDYATQSSARDGANFNYLEMLRNIANDTDGANPQFSNANETLAARQSGMTSSLGNTMAQGASGIQSAMSDLASTAGKSIDISGIFNSLEEAIGQKPETEEEKLLKEWLYKQQLSGAQLGTANNTKKLSEIYNM